ncbi:hypothetical protein [Paenibacillus senegalensis]|uniref:hypothetical protein n=1 Tax=Paenibacillus senegalensis TaxID=1465766 RepID=UPI0011DD5E8E|nr:hypothetical protein [Paenibacillus senegalensis]
MKKLKINLGATLIIGVLVLVTIVINKNSVFLTLLFERFSTEQVNILARLTQYSHIYHIIYNNGVVRFFFGNGMGTETNILDGLLIHNIILKLIYSAGIIGALVYILYYFIVLKDFKNVSFEGFRLKKYFYGVAALGITSFMEPVMYTAFIEFFLVVYVAFLSVVKKLSKLQ